MRRRMGISMYIRMVCIITAHSLFVKFGFVDYHTA